MKLLMFLFLSFSEAVAQFVTYPLNVGDRWVYAYSPLTGGGTFSVHVASDTIMPNGKTYSMKVYSSVFDFERQSGDSVFLFDLYSKREVLYFDFSRNTGDTVSSAPFGPDTMDIVQANFSLMDLFGASRRVWTFAVNPRRHAIDDEYVVNVADSLGAIGRYLYFGDPYGLQGAVLNGRVYGTILGVGIPHSEQPQDFVVWQNYPNPFNPSTTIRFNLLRSPTVTLNVYNVLGERMSAYNLLHLSAGDHELHLDGNSWPAGVYYYRVSTGNVSETRKMLLQK